MFHSSFGRVSEGMLSTIRNECSKLRRLIDNWIEEVGIQEVSVNDDLDFDEGYLLELSPEDIDCCRLSMLYYGRELQIIIATDLCGTAVFVEYVDIDTKKGCARIEEILDAFSAARIWYMNWGTHKSLGIQLESETLIHRTTWGSPVTEFALRVFGVKPEKFFPYRPWLGAKAERV